nr:hypothetical protein [Fodinicola feengrottensis]
MTPLAGGAGDAAERVGLGDQRGSNTDAKQRDNGPPGALAGATPDLGLAWPSVRAQLSNCSGASRCGRTRAASGTPDQPSVGAYTNSGCPGTTAPGTPTPTPSRSAGSTPTCPVTSFTPLTSRSAISSGAGWAVSNGKTAVPTSVSMKSKSPIWTCVSPMSTPATKPTSPRTRTNVRGRPPSESTSPASITSPSAIRSATTLLTVAELRPDAPIRSCRLVGPCK